MDLLDYFDRVAVVNLPSRRDRLRLITRELNSVGAQIGSRNVQVFPAVRPQELRGFPSIGAHGCFMSHLTILKQALADGLSTLLVIEDDLQFTRTCQADEKAVLTGLTDRIWDMVYFGHGFEPPDNARGLFEAHRPVQNLHFYGVNRPCMERLVTFLETVLSREPGHPLGGPMHVDGAFSTFRAQQPDIRTWLAAPSLGGQRSSHSDIAMCRWYDRTPIVRQMTMAAREVKSWLRN